MTNQTTKVKNGSIALPKEIRKSWKGAQVFIETTDDTISIKRLAKPVLSLREMMDEFRKAALRIKLSKKTASAVVREVRKKIYK